MSVAINNKSLKDMNHNGNIVKKWIHNGIKVWEHFVSVKATCSGGVIAKWAYGATIFPYGYQISKNSRSSIDEAGCIKWSGSYCQWKAITNCKITVSVSMSIYCYDNDAYYRCYLYRNGKLAEHLFTGPISKQTYKSGSATRTFNMSAGETAHIAIEGGGGNSSDNRVGFEGGVTINAISN